MLYRTLSDSHVMQSNSLGHQMLRLPTPVSRYFQYSLSVIS